MTTRRLAMCAAAFAAAMPAQVVQNEMHIRTFEHAVGGPGIMMQAGTPMEGIHQMAVEYVGAEMGVNGRVVKGAPYSAQTISETTQTLADGNRIRNRTTSSIYRDSEGRTRREPSLGTMGLAPEAEMPELVFISDPLAGYNYVLNMKERTAQKSKIVAPDQAMADLKRHLEKIAAEGREGLSGNVTFESRAGLPDKALDEAKRKIVFTRNGIAGEVGGDAGFQVKGDGNGSMRTFTYRIGGGPGSEGKTESLGRQAMEGVPADGTRTSFSIEAGKIGNERPLDIVSERWYSPELQTVVYSKHSDPRMGETVFRLTNISRSEPMRSLFEVPADFKITEGKSGDMLRMRVPAPPK